VISFPNKRGQKCIYFGSFFENHEHKVRHNVCIVPRSDEPIVLLANCRGPVPSIHENAYMTPTGTATALCGYDKAPITFLRLKKYGIERNSTVEKLPDEARTILEMSKQTLLPTHDNPSSIRENEKTRLSQLE